MSQTPAALQAANAVFQEQFKPAVRLMVAPVARAFGVAAKFKLTARQLWTPV